MVAGLALERQNADSISDLSTYISDADNEKFCISNAREIKSCDLTSKFA
jgi:hypothetical protein